MRLTPAAEAAARAALQREAERMLKAGWRMVDGRLTPPS